METNPDGYRILLQDFRAAARACESGDFDQVQEAETKLAFVPPEAVPRSSLHRLKRLQRKAKRLPSEARTVTNDTIATPRVVPSEMPHNHTLAEFSDRRVGLSGAIQFADRGPINIEIWRKTGLVVRHPAVSLGSDEVPAAAVVDSTPTPLSENVRFIREALELERRTEGNLGEPTREWQTVQVAVS